MRDLFPQGSKKADLLRKSLELFSERGYDAVSVRDIAKAAGVSEAALYKHFAGKQEMAQYIFNVIAAEYTARIKAGAAETADSVGKLCRIVGVTYRLYREFPQEIRFALLSQYYFWDRVPDEDKPHFVLRQIVEDGMEKGEIPKREVYFWITVYSGLLLQPLAQYPFFYDVLPEFDTLTDDVEGMVRKLFA